MSRSTSSNWKINGPAKASTIIILAHGAGAGMETPFMEFFAQGLADCGLRLRCVCRKPERLRSRVAETTEFFAGKVSPAGSCTDKLPNRGPAFCKGGVSGKKLFLAEPGFDAEEGVTAAGYVGDRRHLAPRKRF